MTIICLEGPSAVGKSSTALELHRQAGFTWIKEVNALFARPEPEPQSWYLERQAQRCQQARANAPAVLDGDPFQAIWYGWTYPEVYPGWVQDMAFQRAQVASGELKFPDLYVVLQTSETELRRRKASDATRSRRNFELHLKLLETQPHYFQVLAELMPGRVLFVQAVTVKQTAERIAEACLTLPADKTEDLLVFDQLTSWLHDRAAFP